jgi:hypothetical protein
MQEVQVSAKLYSIGKAQWTEQLNETIHTAHNCPLPYTKTDHDA